MERGIKNKKILNQQGRRRRTGRGPKGNREDGEEDEETQGEEANNQSALQSTSTHIESRFMQTPFLQSFRFLLSLLPSFLPASLAFLSLQIQSPFLPSFLFAFLSFLPGTMCHVGGYLCREDRQL